MDTGPDTGGRPSTHPHRQPQEGHIRKQAGLGGARPLWHQHLHVPESSQLNMFPQSDSKGYILLTEQTEARKARLLLQPAPNQKLESVRDSTWEFLKAEIRTELSLFSSAAQASNIIPF